MWLTGVSVAPAGQLSGVVAVAWAELSCDVIWTKIITFTYKIYFYLILLVTRISCCSLLISFWVTVCCFAKHHTIMGHNTLQLWDITHYNFKVGWNTGTKAVGRRAETFAHEKEMVVNFERLLLWERCSHCTAIMLIQSTKAFCYKRLISSVINAMFTVNTIWIQLGWSASDIAAVYRVTVLHGSDVQFV